LSEVKIGKAWGAACLRQVLIASTILLIFVIAFVGLVVMAFVFPISQSQRPSLIFGGLMLILVLILTGVLIWGVLTIKQRAARLDAAFDPLGLNGRAYLWNGRQYHGAVGGRQVDAYYYRGPSLDIYIASSLHTRMGIGLKGRLPQMASRITNQPELILKDPAFAQLVISSIDENWGGDLLGNAEAREAILRLESALPGFEFRNLLFQPEALQLQIYLMNPGSITPEKLCGWMEDLANLVGIAESLPAPLVTAMATPIERRARINRGGSVLPIVGITCGVFAFFATLIMVIILLLFNLSGSG
jgi:hypothetical protein